MSAWPPFFEDAHLPLSKAHLRRLIAPPQEEMYKNKYLPVGEVKGSANPLGMCKYLWPPGSQRLWCLGRYFIGLVWPRTWQLRSVCGPQSDRDTSRGLTVPSVSKENNKSTPTCLQGQLKNRVMREQVTA
ncbi:hypothetical protein DPEC_G00003870 [Dallia pectoralis]|uniref:Uncharacterized protein n=1 Tax=Dallia pectoralis TaxID=75939 RepID=A0ACC2HKF8_DALPE|nr:hypothetical protein DPEC_G00003870 [Dallia pectoralis]